MFLTSCVIGGLQTEYINGEPILPVNSYTFKTKLSANDFKKLDTTCLYIEIFEIATSNDMQRANPSILRFHNDGFYKKDSYLYFGKFDKERNKKSAYYGGKYYLKDNKIFIESFYPTSPRSKTLFQQISSGRVSGDTVVLKIFNSEHRYLRKSFNQVFPK
jgi:hypothetical protein